MTDVSVRAICEMSSTRQRPLAHIFKKIKNADRNSYARDFSSKTKLSVYDSNPFSSGATNSRDPVLTVTVAGVPLSIQDTEIVLILLNFNIELKSEIRYETIRNPVTGKKTSVLNGNWFVYTAPLPDGTYLPRVSYCACRKLFTC